MVFSSLLFLFVFLPAFLTIYYLTPVRWRNITALAGSYFFYAWGAPQFVFILLASSIIDYILSRFIYKTEKKKIPLAISLVLNICLLGVFKYANFFVGEFNNILEVFGFQGAHWTYIALPIGISFFTFQKISYMVDVYRGTTKPARNVFDFLLYVALFPQLIAGPIVRYHDIAAQLKKRRHSLEKVFEGIYRFCIGLGKKVLIANVVGEVADKIFALGNPDMTVSFAWVGIIAYALQIYFDFAGYSDMAIGLGKMMGFDFLENFNCPYVSQSITEFWRRWHISLSRFMREYLYIPLGGNRVSQNRTYINAWIIFLISGLWHGAAWTFVVWGVYNGLFISLDKMFWSKLSKKIPKIINILITFFFVLIGWVFFRSETFVQAGHYLQSMFGFVSSTTNILWVDVIVNRGWIVFGLGLLFSFIPGFKLYDIVIEKLRARRQGYARIFVKACITGIILALSVLSLANASFNPFIYFRF
jgi:alginate O-acetyltransferase complex protein AlgI